jgi:hypothetical protein
MKQGLCGWGSAIGVEWCSMKMMEEVLKNVNKL